MNRFLITYILFISVFICYSTRAQAPLQNNHGFPIHNHGSSKIPDQGSSRNGKFVIDSTHTYLGSTIGQNWFHYQRYLVSERDQWGNFLKAATLEFDTINNQWSQYQKYEASYFDSLTTSFWNAQVWDSKAGNWRLSDSTSFNADGDPVINWYKVWDPVKFRFWRGQRIIYAYQTEVLLSRDIQKFDTLSGNWKPDESYAYSYNDDGLLINKLIMEWDTAGNDWKNHSQIQYTYNEGLSIQSEITQLWGDGMTWVNNSKFEYAYDEDSGKLIKRTRFSWASNVAWDLVTQTLYTYNDNLWLVEALSQVWVEFENQWYNTTVNYYVYNSQGQRTEILLRSWDFTGHWVNESENLFTYDDDGNQVQYVFKVWNDENNLWDNYYKTNNFWSEFVPAGIDNISGLNVQIFPNPTSSIVNLSLKENVKSMMTSVYTMDGKLMLQKLIGANQTQINVAGFPAGQYLIVVNAEGKRYTQILIKG